MSAPPPCSVVVLLAQITDDGVITPAPGNAFTITVTFFTVVQAPMLCVTVYTVVSVGLTIIDAFVLPPGDQL